jgi:beta-ketodecanoyl-[acyl-carrier-protein] synthase
VSDIVISGSGLYTPPYSISNDELVNAFNHYLDLYYSQHSDGIEAGRLSRLIVKASGIQRRETAVTG